jgi:hypothetical protein
MNPRSTIRGTVERFGERQINILVANTEELRAFYRQHAPRAEPRVGGKSASEIHGEQGGFGRPMQAR